MHITKANDNTVTFGKMKIKILRIIEAVTSKTIHEM